MIWEFLKSRSNLLEYLANELINSRITLFIGSGISLSFKVLGWNDLVQDVCLVAGVKYDPTVGNDVLMNYCKAALGNKYKQTVKNSLYKTYNPDLNQIATNKLLVALGALVIGSKRGKVNKVVTYNYDDVLETYLLYHGYMPNSISKVPYIKIDSDIDIYHPHGFLPFLIGKDSEILVLDQDSYVKSTGIDNPFYREIESAALSTTCLFIGISGRDRAVNDLLIRSYENHISRYTKNSVQGFIFKLESDIADFEEESLKSKGIFCIKIHDHDEIPIYLSEICQRALIIKFKDIFNKLALGS
jgi:hypothetical protein